MIAAPGTVASGGAIIAVRDVDPAVPRSTRDDGL
jgi:hypothetical protein